MSGMLQIYRKSKLHTKHTCTILKRILIGIANSDFILFKGSAFKYNFTWNYLSDGAANTLLSLVKELALKVISRCYSTLVALC